MTDPLSAAFAHKGILYSGFTVPLCGILSISGATFDTWVGIQMFLSALGCVLICVIGTKLVDFRAGVTAGFALALLWDTFQWDVYVLSDSLFVFGIVLVLGSLTWHHHNRTALSRLAVFVTMGYLMLSRPHGFPLVAGWVLYDLFPQGDKRRLDLFKTRIVPLLSSIGVVAAIPYAISRYELVDIMQVGWIVINDPNYIYPFISESGDGGLWFVLTNIHHIFVMAVLKTVLFFAPLLPRQSTTHIVINLLTYLPILLIGFIGLLNAWREDYHLFRMWATPVLVLVAITAVTFVSWDFRYRAPLGPVFALGFGYALSTVFGGAIDQVIKRGRDLYYHVRHVS
jgi:hypothetical protein